MLTQLLMTSTSKIQHNDLSHINIEENPLITEEELNNYVDKLRHDIRMIENSIRRDKINKILDNIK